MCNKEECTIDNVIENVITDFMIYQLNHKLGRYSKFKSLVTELKAQSIIDDFQIWSEGTSICCRVYKDDVQKQFSVSILPDRTASKMNSNEIQKAFLNGEYSFTLNKVHTTDRITVHDKMSPEENKEVYDFVVRAISAYGATDVEEVKHGIWVHTDTYDMYHTPIYSCSACYHEIPTHYIAAHSRCPYCGAKMDKERKEK